MSRESLKRKTTDGAELLAAEAIVIDEAKGLVFASEDELYAHFAKEISQLESSFFAQRQPEDIAVEQFEEYEELLTHVLEDPDEVWEDGEALTGEPVYNYLGRFEIADREVFYAAQAYVADEIPSFVFLHFPTTDLQLIEQYRKGELVYDRVMKDVEKGAIEGDALSEGDELAVGLYKSMLKVRSDKDIKEEEFHRFIDFREETIEEADEIWRNTDLRGYTLVSFIRELPESEDPDLFYIVVTVEDEPSSSHALLFSFPTRDQNLVDRYRHGENLQADEVVQEASH